MAIRSWGAYQKIEKVGTAVHPNKTWTDQQEKQPVAVWPGSYRCGHDELSRSKEHELSSPHHTHKSTDALTSDYWDPPANFLKDLFSYLVHECL